MSKPGIYMFSKDFGGEGSLSGMFVATDEEIAAGVGRQCHFDEILEEGILVTYTLTDQNPWLINDDPRSVQLFQYLGLTTGINPLHYLTE